jgi:hypothetical protein
MKGALLQEAFFCTVQMKEVKEKRCCEDEA